MNGYNMLYYLAERMGEHDLLEALIRTLREEEARENAEYIARM